MREGRRQRDPDPGDHLGDAGGHFDQPESDGVELSGPPDRSFGREVTHAVHQPVGGGVDQQSELIGGGFGARCAIGSQVQFVGFDQVLGLAASAVVDLIKLMLQALKIGDNETGGVTRQVCLNAHIGEALSIRAAIQVVET